MRRSLEGPSSAPSGLRQFYLVHTPTPGPENHPGLVPEKVLAIINVKDCLDMNEHLIKSWSFCETFSKLQDSIIQTLYFWNVGLQVNQGKIINSKQRLIYAKLSGGYMPRLGYAQFCREFPFS